MEMRIRFSPIVRRSFGAAVLGLWAAAAAPTTDPNLFPPPLEEPEPSAANPCAGAAGPARFKMETRPPLTMTPGATAAVSVTFVNCSGATWVRATNPNAPTGVKLGSQAPQDGLAWGLSRVVLPQSVADRASVTVDFTVHAPATPGLYPYSWGIVDEGVRWMLPTASPVSYVSVTAARSVAMCPGITADAGGIAPAAESLQRCIDATPDGGTLEIPPGLYRMDRQVLISRPLTLRTAGTAGSTVPCFPSIPGCATLQATPDLHVGGGFLKVAAASHVTLDHLVFDGNRPARLSSEAATSCKTVSNSFGFNAQVAGTRNATMTWSASIRALCGTAFGWYGDDALIANNVIRDNGRNDANRLWSDGLTLNGSERARVYGNVFAENTDVALILGGTRDGLVRDNQITQHFQRAFAALMLHRFSTASSGQFDNTVVRNNRIDCKSRKCDFGIMLGPHPWDPTVWISGGIVRNNTVTAAKQGINVEGVETIELYSNTVTESPSSANFLCGPRDTSLLNVGPDSSVDRHGETSPPATARRWHHCP
jgi:hypothetical protein